MKPSAIDQHIWNKYYDVYVEDAYDLGLEKTFSEKNPYALQEMTAVMLESARKGMWHATDVQLREVAELHTRSSRNMRQDAADSSATTPNCATSSHPRWTKRRPRATTKT